MPRLKKRAEKDGLLRRVKKQRLNYITILPSLITILNGVFGFAAIVFAGAGSFAKAGYLILLAMIADMLDGRVARMSRSTSSFGGQLDSICDVISFGVAPAFLTLEILQHNLKLAELNLVHRFIWFAAAAYISCAAIRLARFNVENEEDETAHMSFIGLPTPAAAGVVVSLIIFHQETLPVIFENTQNSQAQLIFENAIIYALPFLLLGTAILMISRIRYPHIINQYIKGKKPFAHLIKALLVLGLIVSVKIRTVLVLCFFGFAASGFLKWFFYKIIRHKEKLVTAIEPAAQIAADKTNIELNDDSI